MACTCYLLGHCVVMMMMIRLDLYKRAEVVPCYLHNALVCVEVAVQLQAGACSCRQSPAVLS
jgi:hypothetical protein